MEMRKLQQMGGNDSGGVTIPKDILRDVGAAGPDGIDDSFYVTFDQDDDDDHRVELRIVGVGD